jgi:hypothetical protein
MFFSQVTGLLPSDCFYDAIHPDISSMNLSPEEHGY